MAGEVIIVGLSSGPVWGCPDLSWGKGQSLDKTVNGSSKKLADGQGNAAAVAYYDDETSVSYTVKVCGEVPALTRGMVLSVEGENMVLDNFKVGDKNDDFREIQLELKSWPGITLPTPGA